MSKIYERCIHNSFSSSSEAISSFILAYRKFYSSNHVLLRLTENWKKSRDNNKTFLGTVLMDISTAFHYIPHHLLASNLQAHGLTEDAVTFVHSYLKRRN